jgi:hypothetical protein
MRVLFADRTSVPDAERISATPPGHDLRVTVLAAVHFAHC